MAKKKSKPLVKETSANSTALMSDDSAVCPIIGIGASAGGLETLGEFLQNMPDDCGVGIVIVQHLDPDRKAIMAELLQRDTNLSVEEATDGVRVKPNHVYLIAPNKDMSILRGCLHLFDPAEAKGRRLPIDFFFRSLGEDQKDRAVAVVLSGMGTDGTMGIRAIKEHGGVSFVQEPASAKFAGMPSSVVSDGFVDVIAPVADLPTRILACLNNTKKPPQVETKINAATQNSIEKILILLRSKTGHDFYQYKKNTILRRIERRMSIHQIEDLSIYIRYLQENSNEIHGLFNELLIGVTKFFRDSAVWDHLKAVVLPEILKAYPEGGQLRAWTPGCSTGEEAYSLAIVLKEVISELRMDERFRVQIFATDIDTRAIEKARDGVYPASIVSEVSDSRLHSYFIQNEMGWKIRQDVRESVIFAEQNVAMDPPFTKLDIVLCRNLLIYVDPSLQKKIISLFHYSLNPGGALVLGSAETVSNDLSLFSTLSTKHRIYRPITNAPPVSLTELPTNFRQVANLEYVTANKGKSPMKIGEITDRIILQQHSPAAILISRSGNILYVSGRTGKYLEPAEGNANWNILAMARGGLKMALQGPLSESIIRSKTKVIKDVVVDSDEGGVTLDVVIQPFPSHSLLKENLLVLFKEKQAIKPSEKIECHGDQGASQVKRLKRELSEAREHVQLINEEMQTSEEELKSSNEELQSTNEELQSTNEELTTSKEEMQSMNEELQTVNQELKGKIDDLSQANNDMRNLLDSTDIATLFLDNELNVRRFTAKATEVFNLISGDIGRPFTDITSALDYPEMRKDALQVLRTLAYSEKGVQASGGRWFFVRIMPYRTLDNRIDGLVITFSDITASKCLEHRLRDKEADALKLLQNMPKPFALLEVVLDSKLIPVDGKYLFVNEMFEQVTGYKRRDIVGQCVSKFWPDSDPTWKVPLQEAYMSDEPFAFSVRLDQKSESVQSVAYRPGRNDSQICLILSSI